MTEERLKKLVDYVKELSRQHNELEATCATMGDDLTIAVAKIQSLEAQIEWLRSQFVAEGKGAAVIIDPEQHRADHDRIATLEAELAKLNPTVIANDANFTAYDESKEPPFEEPKEVAR